MDRKKVAAVLEDTAVLLELKGENPFKVRAYRQAARTVLGLEGDLAELAQSGELTKVKGLGKTTAAQVAELVETGSLSYLEELRASFPEGLLEILRVPGLGPKKVKTLHEELEINSLAELEYACRENRLLTLKGFGPKSQKNVLEGIESLKKYRGRHLWAEVEAEALALEKALAEGPGMSRVRLAGSFRRFKEIIKDLDLVAVSDAPEEAARYIEGLDMVEKLEAAGKTKLTFRLKSGLSVDLRLTTEESYPFTLHHFTGSKEHNTRMRQRAKDRGLKLNEYGLFDESDVSKPASDEAGVFSLLDLTYIPPELREDYGEIEAAEKGALPELIEAGDLKGVFHVHTNYSDGGLTVAEVVEACIDLGFEYVGLADHSQSAFYAGGLSLEDLDRQYEEVEKARAAHPDFGIFWGIESDIRPDGSLDYPDETLSRFDFIIASVHSHFRLKEKDQTARLVGAAQNPYTTILGHPTGRLLLGREPYEMDLPAVLKAAAKAGTVVEINANPHRLDLDWREMGLARSLGLKMMVCPDAHSAEGLRDIRYGVYAARKGWLTKSDVLNCLGREELAARLRKKAS